MKDDFKGTTTIEVESNVNIMGESMQDLKNFVDALNSLTEEQVYNYMKGKKLFEIYERKHSAMQKIIDKYKNQHQKNSKMLEKEVNDLEQKFAKYLEKLETNVKSKSKEFYSLCKCMDIVKDNFDLENPKEEDIYIQLNFSFEIDIDYTYLSYVPATMWEPAEGGYPELDDYDAWDETHSRVVDLLKMLNIYSSCDFDIIDCEYPDEDRICEDIEDCFRNQEPDDYDGYDY